MITTTYGYKRPETNDRGAVVFPAMEQNIDRLDAHDHDGTDSALLTPRAVPTEMTAISSGSWVLVANGIYKQAVTMPLNMDFDKVVKEFKLTASGAIFYPTIIRLSSTQYEIYINDNTLSVEARYK